MKTRNTFFVVAAIVLCCGFSLINATADDPITWPIDEQTSGADVLWISDSPVRPDAGLFEVEYVITEVWAYIHWLIFYEWVNVTDQIPPENLTGSEFVDGPAPITFETQSFVFPEPPAEPAVAADLTMGIYADGYAWAHITNVILGTYVLDPFGEVDILTVRLVGLITMTASDPMVCPADLTGDDMVNIDDIFAVLGLWGDCPDPCPPYCAGDITEDCTVNIDDIFAILGMWGPCE